VVVIGAGIAGLGAAMYLAKARFEVTIVERDAGPPTGDPVDAFFTWDRDGAGQFRHPHAFLGLMCRLIEQDHPDLLERLFEADARRVSFEDLITPKLRASYTPAPGDEELWMMSCRRATVENVLHTYVAGLAGVKILHGRVTGLLSDASIPANVSARVTGVELDGEPLTADVVVDASGRNSQYPRWLSDLDVSLNEERHDAEIVYYTRHYQLADGEAEPPRGELPGNGDLGYLKFGTFAAERGHFSIILCLPMGETGLREAVRDADEFDRICATIPGLAQWLQRGNPVTVPAGMGDIFAVWREPAADSVMPLGFHAIGDARIRTNPLYGRGCSTGMLQAKILSDVLSDVSDSRLRTDEMARRVRDEVRPVWDASLADDQRGITRASAVIKGEPEKARSIGRWLRNVVADAASAAARNEISVIRSAMRSFNLLAPPGAFMKDWRVRAALLRYVLRGRRRNATVRIQRGPDRLTMYELLGRVAP